MTDQDHINTDLYINLMLCQWDKRIEDYGRTMRLLTWRICKIGEDRDSYIANPKKVVDKYVSDRKRRISKLKEGK
jgi:hypothetical protein